MRFVPLVFLLFLCALTGCNPQSSLTSKMHDPLERELEECNAGISVPSYQPVKKEVTSYYTFYEEDSIRIYISPYFYKGFLAETEAASDSLYHTFTNVYGTIFEKSIVTGKMFFCAFNENCEDYNKNKEIMVHEGDTIIKVTPEVFGYRGSLVKLLNIQLVPELSSVKEKVIEMWANSSKMGDGWSGFAIYYLKIKNEDADNQTSLKDFIRNARLSCFIFDQYRFNQGI